ncbi:MAG: hypothetical protein WBO97_10640 [Tepidiformaceae bacterium]
MTSPQPRRTRRRAAPAASLPRPVAGTGGNALNTAAQAPRSTPTASTATAHHRQHHVTKDYSYVHKDLILVSIFSVAVLAFIVAMSFIVS